MLVDGSMGSLAGDSIDQTRAIGTLGVQVNGLRRFYRCVQEAVNASKPADQCLKAAYR